MLEAIKVAETTVVAIYMARKGNSIPTSVIISTPIITP